MRVWWICQGCILTLPTVVQMIAPHFVCWPCLFFFWRFPAMAIRAVKPLCTKLHCNCVKLKSATSQASMLRWDTFNLYITGGVPSHIPSAILGHGTVKPSKVHILKGKIRSLGSLRVATSF